MAWGLRGAGKILRLVFSFGVLGGALLETNGETVSERRQEVLRAADARSVGVIAGALGDENAVVRRTAARLLAEVGDDAWGALTNAFGNDDYLVRRTALGALCALRPGDALGWVERGLGDEDAVVRRLAVDWLVGRAARDEAATGLLLKARADADAGIREVASAALFPFQRENISLRDRKDYDHDVRVARRVPLPVSGWELRLDPDDVGHVRGWYAAGAGGAGWTRIEIGRTWESQGYEHDGVGWYRLSFDMPEGPGKCVAVDVAFDGVDDAAWVWLNGEFIGGHDVGKAGRTQPFRLDVTRELNWGGKNVLVVRVVDSGDAGGIWKPVRIEVLE